MTLHAARTIWEDIQNHPLNEFYSSSRQDFLNLLELNLQIKIEIENVFQNPHNGKYRIAIKESSDKLPSLIPSLNGETQVYFAKLYRICQLILENN